MTREISDSVRETIARRDRAGDDLDKRVVAALDVLPIEELRVLARLYVDECGYLGEHTPGERESVAPFACSGETYHYCSFSTEHDPGCPAVGGDGKLSDRFQHSKPCAPDCGETDAEPWCSCSGFECPTCEMVDRLLGLLEAHGG